MVRSSRCRRCHRRLHRRRRRRRRHRRRCRQKEACRQIFAT